MNKLAILSTTLLLVLGIGACAATVDLTTADSFGFLNGAFFLQIDPLGAQGTGNFDSFLRLQANGTENGYNTDGTLEFDTKGGIWTHILDLQSINNNVPVVDGSTVPGLTPGVGYREFLLDINESVGNLLSLDAVKFYQSDQPDNTGYPNIGNLVFDLGADNWVKLNYDLNPGSGQGDVAMYLPSSLFTQRYLYLYTEFGYQGGDWASDNGFEEWGVRVAETPQPVIPEASTLLLALSGLAPVAAYIRRRA